MRIGIDLGGTKIEGLAIDEAGAERGRVRMPTPRDDYEASLAVIADLVARLEGEAGDRGTVGVGGPGAISPVTGRVKNANSVWLNGRAIDRDLSARLGRPVRYANDANCLAVSEATDGAAAGARLVLGVILGTGAGAGIAIDGRPHEGPNRVAGEWGHNPLPWPSPEERPGPPCWCGRSGCLETWVSGTGLEADYRRAGGGALSAAEIARRAEAGEALAAARLAAYADRLARGLAHLVNVLDPDVIVLGGGLSNVSRLYSALPERLPAYVFGGECRTPVVPARHGDSSGVRGAAWLWPRGASW
ncbi:MAG TPA: fructokinase [Thermodesulfobacteriota bacterium]